jgi:hypothetical protein
MALTDNTMLLGDLYFDRLREEAYASFEKLARAAKQTGIAKQSDAKPWLEGQDAYTLHRAVRKRISAIPIPSLILWIYGNVTWWTYSLSQYIMTTKDFS